VMESALWLCGVGFVCTLLTFWLWWRPAPQVAAAVPVATPLGECLKSS